MPAIFAISNGTQTLSFLNGEDGIYLGKWKPQIAPYKNGGNFNTSEFVEGTKFISGTYDYADEVIPCHIVGETQAIALARHDAVLGLLKQAEAFNAAKKGQYVYLIFKPDEVSTTYYARIESGNSDEVPELLGVAFEGGTTEGDKALINCGFVIKRDHWSPNLPGTGTCATLHNLATGVSIEWSVYHPATPGGTANFWPGSLFKRADGRIYAGLEYGDAVIGFAIKYSDNGGVSFSDATVPANTTDRGTIGLGNQEWLELANGNLLVARRIVNGGPCQILKSTNGTTFTNPTDIDTVSTSVTDLGQDAGGSVYIVTRKSSENLGRCWKSTDNGTSFTNVGNMSISPGFSPLALAIDTADDSIFVAVSSTGIYKSVNDGVTWTLQDAPSNPVDIWRGPDGMYLITTDSKVYRKPDGETRWWTLHATIPATGNIIKNICHLDWVDGEMSVINNAGGTASILMSSDNGDSWESYYPPSGGDYSAGVFNSTGGPVLAYAINTFNVYIQSGQVSSSGTGSAASCEPVPIGNRLTSAIINFMFYRDNSANSYSSNLLAASKPLDFLPPNTIQTTDFLYLVGSVSGSGPIAGVYWPLQVEGVGTMKLTYQYYSTTGWKTLPSVRDDTENFTRSGAISWAMPTDIDVDADPQSQSIAGSYYRIGFASGSYTTRPTLASNPYSINLPRVTLGNEIPGGMSSLASFKIHHHTPFFTGDTNDLRVNRIVMGAKAYDEDTTFVGFIPLNQHSNASSDISVSLGAGGAFIEVPEIADRFGLSFTGAVSFAWSEVGKATVTGPTDFYGTYRAFLRLKKTNTAVIKARLGVMNNKSGAAYTQARSASINNSHIILDFGTISLPGVNILADEFYESLAISIEAGVVSGYTGASLVVFQDLILIPSDVFIVDAIDFSNSGDTWLGTNATSGGSFIKDQLLVESIRLNGENRSLARRGYDPNPIFAYYMPITSGPMTLPHNTNLDFWVLMMNASATGVSGFVWTANPSIVGSIELEYFDRYLVVK